MKKLVIVLLALFIGFASNTIQAQKKENKVVCFKSNMDCANCQTKVNEYLKFEKGVKDLKVDFESNTIFIAYKEGKNTDEKLAKAIEKKGYVAEQITFEEYKKLTSKKEKE